MGKKIIWLEDEPADIETQEALLTKRGHFVRVVKTLTQAEELLKAEPWDLLILDVMIPTKTPEEERHYLPHKTLKTVDTGLAFYKRMKENLKLLKNTIVFVLTQRLDQEIIEKFQEAGLPRHCFENKFKMAHAQDFLNKVDSLLERGNNGPM